MTANKVQVGGTHYKTDGEEHWDRVNRLKLDYFQGQITKYVERCWKKNGIEDLKKARHFLDKYIELNEHKPEVKLSGDTSNLERGLERLAELTEEALDTLKTNPLEGATFHAVHGSEKYQAAPDQAMTAPWKVDVPAAERIANERIANLYPEVDPLSGWINAQFEGNDAQGTLWRCRKCHASYRTPVFARPDDYHPCRLDGSTIATMAAEPDARYTNQG